MKEVLNGKRGTFLYKDSNMKTFNVGTFEYSYSLFSYLLNDLSTELKA